MKRYYVKGPALITYIRPATDADKVQEGAVRTDAMLARDALIDYTFNHSDILPDEYMTVKLPNGKIMKIPSEGYCYTVYDINRPMGWFWIGKSAVEEID